MIIEYKGKLYGKTISRRYFDTGKTSEDWDKMKKRIEELEKKNDELLTKLNKKKKSVDNEPEHEETLP